MRFGLFGSAQARRPEPGAELTDSSQGFREWIENNVEAEALGFHSTFVVEHHFTGFGQVSASLNLLTWLGARTSTLRLGTAVLVLPWHNPVLLAEQAATLDLLSGGRLDFGVGKGYRYNEFAGFAMPMEEADARFDESMDVITKAFVSTRRSAIKGKYWQFDNVIVEPPPAKRPHPPFWMGAGSERSVRQVADRGYNLLLGQYDLRGRRPPHRPVQERRDGARPALRPDAGRRRPRGAFRRHRRGAGGGAGAALPGPSADQQARRAAGRRARALRPPRRGRGAPPVRRHRDLRHARPDRAASWRRCAHGGVEYVIVNFGGSRENIRRFARDIMPAFADEPRLAAAAK